ncbi:MAG: TIR domain-containing protein [Candidatus Heimdallarchaeota archaeon]|nr:TIR domain-containing protein [Candidatus Heimdallarchaeota archaeon]
MIKRLADKFKSNDKTITWVKKEEKEDFNEMIYRFPNKEKNDYKKLHFIGVRDYERALYFKSGQNAGVLTGGFYEIEKEARNAATEIIWVNPGIIIQKFGIVWKGGIPPQTSDGFAIGGSGDLSIRIQDPEAFVSKIVVGKSSFTDSDAKDLIRNLVSTSFRDVVKRVTLKDFFQQDRERFTSMLRVKLSDEFRIYGLELVAANLLDIAYPPENERLIKKILESKKDDLQKNMKEKNDMEDDLKRYKNMAKDLEDQWAVGEVSNEEYQDRSLKLKSIIQRRADELNTIKQSLGEPVEEVSQVAPISTYSATANIKSKVVKNPDVFISFSTKNVDIAERVYQGLDNANMKTWISTRSIEVGEEYNVQILDAIDTTKIFLILISKDSVNSRHVSTELERAFSKKRHIIPVRLDDGPIPRGWEYYLSTTQWRDVSSVIDLSWIKDLVSTLTDKLKL